MQIIVKVRKKGTIQTGLFRLYAPYTYTHYVLINPPGISPVTFSFIELCAVITTDCLPLRKRKELLPTMLLLHGISPTPLPVLS